jgi:8-oxo-dGTP pyrophosphatase MutT (NUDIX family)
MDEKRLIWSEENRNQVFNCNVFSVWESYCKPPKTGSSTAKARAFSVIEAKDWVIIVPVIESEAGKKLVMVWQWRHGSRSISLEFPGGVFEIGETPQDAAVRELREETGYTPGKIEMVGEFSPNPAIMTNKVHFFLASDLSNTGSQSLDEDEFVEVALVDPEEAVQGMGKKPFIHALMGTALSLCYRKIF